MSIESPSKWPQEWDCLTPGPLEGTEDWDCIEKPKTNPNVRGDAAPVKANPVVNQHLDREATPQVDPHGAFTPSQEHIIAADQANSFRNPLEPLA